MHKTQVESGKNEKICKFAFNLQNKLRNFTYQQLYQLLVIQDFIKSTLQIAFLNENISVNYFVTVNNYFLKKFKLQ